MLENLTELKKKKKKRESDIQDHQGWLVGSDIAQWCVPRHFMDLEMLSCWVMRSIIVAYAIIIARLVLLRSALGGES